VFAPIPGAALRIEHALAARVRHDDKDVLVAGRLDRLVLLPGRTGAWIVDFKSDRVETLADEARLALTYAPQLRLYARAVARAYGLPVPAIRCTLALLGPRAAH
jgi:ATP-dependent exoDNAse (exonuclease V) beta subunit